MASPNEYPLRVKSNAVTVGETLIVRLSLAKNLVTSNTDKPSQRSHSWESERT